jgi:hypothetical protein
MPNRERLKIVFLLSLLASFVGIFFSYRDSSKKYCRSSEVAVVGKPQRLEQFHNVNSYFHVGGYEIFVAPTNQGYKMVVISSEKIDESEYRSISEEIKKRLEN